MRVARVIAFTARALDADDKGGPKYLNSPETPLYSKGQVLFNLDKARQAIRQQNFALLVEGQMDCISVFAAGVTPVLATSGTAFTEQQARLLRRYTTRLVVNFDPDTAGANAAEKSIALLTEEGFEVRVVTLEGGLDPDRFVREQGHSGLRRGAEGRDPALRLPDRAGAKALPGADGTGQGGGGEFPAAAHPADAAPDQPGRVCAGRGAEAERSTPPCCGRS